MFIALEGIDGSGHTTQARALADSLTKHGRKVHVTQEPTFGPSGQVTRDYMQGRIPKFERFSESLALLFAADRLHHVGTKIKPKLEEGFDVICDRYVLSSWVYQGLEVTEDWVRRINQFAPPPDLTLIIDTPLIEAQQRRESRGGVVEIFETQAIQTTVRERYLDLAPSLHAIIVDGSGSPQDVTDRLTEKTLAALSKF